MIAPPPPKPPPARSAAHNGRVARASTLLSSFGFAFAGLRYLLLTQRNARIHGAVALLVVIAGLVLQIDRSEWLALVITIGLVFATEGANTALEAAVDLASPEYHPLAKAAKDVAAGTVLLAAAMAVVVGMIIFLPRLYTLVTWLLTT